VDIRILFPDDCKTRRGRVALPFSEHRKTVKRTPFGDKYVKEPKTLGEHLRNRRIEKHLLQKDVAKSFNVSEDCVTYWENDRSKPQVQFYPKIISFLGFNPFMVDVSTLGGKIKAYRYKEGLSHKTLGKLLDVDASTVGSWESGVSKPHFETLKKIGKLISTLK
jgi:DNA-binding XRE family transcriptional regulator